MKHRRIDAMPCKFVRRIRNKQLLRFEKYRLTLGAVGQRSLRCIELVECRQIKARVIRLALVGTVTECQESVAVRLVALQPTRHIINLRRAKSADSRPFCGHELHVEADRGHILSSKSVSICRPSGSGWVAIQIQPAAVRQFAPTIAITIDITERVE